MYLIKILLNETLLKVALTESKLITITNFFFFGFWSKFGLFPGKRLWNIG